MSVTDSRDVTVPSQLAPSRGSYCTLTSGHLQLVRFLDEVDFDNQLRRLDSCDFMRRMRKYSPVLVIFR